MIRRRGRFADVVDRQLRLFAEDEVDLLVEAEEALEAWRKTGREEAEEAYGDYQLVADAIADRLLEIREAWAATLAAGDDDAYRATFAHEVARRFRAHPSVVVDLAEEQ